ncbi:MAG TPA: amino acid permease [Gemmatimonadales bacterium]|nr:amino acid permease [Gemmatimonadales bacterium]
MAAVPSRVPEPQLKRQLSLLDATMINVGTIIASAIFLVPKDIAGQLPVSSLAVGVWIVGGLVSLLGALCIAELAAAYPEAGGQFAYLREAYGPVWGYLYGWGSSLIINPASVAAISVGFARYLAEFVPLDGTGIKLVAVGSTVALTVLNCLGVRLGAMTQNVLTFIKVAIVAALIVAAFALPGGSVSNLTPVWPQGGLGQFVGPFGVAMVAVLWAYDGWIESTYVGSEITNPGRNLPRSIVLSTVVAITLYTLVMISFTYVLSASRMAASDRVAADAARVVLGAGGATLVAVAILVSTLGANNGIVLTAARIPYAMARGGLFFRWAGRVNPRFDTPVAALLAQGVVAIVLTASGTYEQLYTYVVFASWLFYAMSCAAVIWLRRKAPQVARPYRAWGYPVTPLVFVAFACYVMVSTIVQSPRDSAVGVLLIAAGLPLYFYFHKRASAVSRQPSAGGDC